MLWYRVLCFPSKILQHILVAVPVSSIALLIVFCFSIINKIRVSSTSFNKYNFVTHVANRIQYGLKAAHDIRLWNYNIAKPCSDHAGQRIKTTDQGVPLCPNLPSSNVLWCRSTYQGITIQPGELKHSRRENDDSMIGPCTYLRRTRQTKRLGGLNGYVCRIGTRPTLTGFSLSLHISNLTIQSSTLWATNGNVEKRSSNRHARFIRPTRHCYAFLRSTSLLQQHS